MNKLKLKELEEFSEIAWKYWTENASQRAGQAFMNALFHYRPDLYEFLTGKKSDPFYDSKKMSKALSLILEEEALFNLSSHKLYYFCK